ncbi:MULTISPECIES: lantibiotic dehydratase [Pseudofrankia]|uniref:lantibiotic dehydratase n=1 Tax=Pseudofrankia TaxID=2994363 RepID=UPI000234C146|nr:MULTISPECIES: lantibiotic dehydratase [Pseudofrankia]OHV40881.1 hypothetical protein BCD49_39200 [Pseudofrankia sp. EUN1h]
MPASYTPAEPVLVRLSTAPVGLDLPHGVGILDDADVDGKTWLAGVWARPDVCAAVALASPALADRVEQLVGREGAGTQEIRRAVLATCFYLARWARRVTPFGLFAGVASVKVGDRATVAAGTPRVAVRADAAWLHSLVARLEADPNVRDGLTVVANSLGVVRDGRFVVPQWPVPVGLNRRAEAPVTEISVRCSQPLAATLAATHLPRRFTDLRADLQIAFPSARAATIRTLLDRLVDQGVLLTNLHPPASAVDGLAHVIDVLRAVMASAPARADLSAPAQVLARLEEIAGELAAANHDASTDAEQATARRARIAEVMHALAPAGVGEPMTAGGVLAVDVRADMEITLPASVLQEAAAAVETLVRVGTRPFGQMAWLEYHSRFLARYGPGALVPVGELLADSGLGYPTGFPAAPRARPVWRMLTERDARLLTLLQRAALESAAEIELTDRVVEALTVATEGEEIVGPGRVEFGFALHAASAKAIDRGRFQLWATATPRAQTSMAGRFAYLLDETDRASLAASFGAGRDGAVAVQLSFPPRYTHNGNVTGVPRLLDEVLSLGEHPDPRDTLTLEDLAVTADADQLYLMRRATGEQVLPRILHALDLRGRTPRLARFLAEVGQSRCAFYGPFDFGAARALPHTPRIRYRRTVLVPARWLVTEPSLRRRTTAAVWDEALAGWRKRWSVPEQVVLCEDDQRLPLDLSQPLDRDLLRARLNRADPATRIELWEQGAADRDGWLGRPAEFTVPMVRTVPMSRRPPVATAAPAPAGQPGDASVVHAQLHGNPARFAEILTGHATVLLTALQTTGQISRWWAGRQLDLIRPETDQHLDLYLRVPEQGAYGPLAARLAAFARDLQARGMLAGIALVGYQPQPGRYGTGAALEAAEAVFAADTAAAIAQLAGAAPSAVPAQALAAASLARLAFAFAPDPTTGAHRLLALPHPPTGPLDRALRDHTLRLTDQPAPATVAAAWNARDNALTRYYRILAEQREPATVLRSLLHDHHVRAVGIDKALEATSLRLAQAAARRYLALHPATTAREPRLPVPANAGP